jgi:hypothetical protein
MDALQMVVTIICTVIASSGFWAFFQKKYEKKDARSQMLLGLGHDRIVYLGMHYLTRVDENGKPYITQDEYESLHDYLYIPYKKLGGDGSAERVMAEANKLPIKRDRSNLEFQNI